MKNGVTLKSVLKKKLEDPEFKKAFDEEELFANIAIQIAKIRQKKGMSQKELAKLIDTKQQAISRIENVSYRRYSINTLSRIARAMNKRLKVSFV
jgi:ribosome-binding protein aMBF1 (putative translation factor)